MSPICLVASSMALTSVAAPRACLNSGMALSGSILVRLARPSRASTSRPDMGLTVSRFRLPLTFGGTFLTSATLMRWLICFLTCSTRSSGGFEKRRRISAGGWSGSSGWTAR